MIKIFSPVNFRVFFIGLVALDIAVGYSNVVEYRLLSKPLILLSLLLYFALNGKHLSKQTFTLMLLALLFSLSGDVFLLFEHLSSKYFIAGLISFLLAHIIYSVVFVKKWNKKTPKTFLFTTFFLVTYGCTLFYFLKDGLGTLKIPVIVYILGIMAMAVTALRRSGLVSMLSFILVLTGAFLFMASDSILAIDKFMFKLPGVHFSVMVTYAAAQLLIVEGIIRQDVDRKI